MKTEQLRMAIPADWRERMERIRDERNTEHPDTATLSTVGRDGIRDYLERLAKPGDPPLSDPVETRGRPRTKDTEAHAGIVTEAE